jgi:hypothetical protein
VSCDEVASQNWICKCIVSLSIATTTACTNEPTFHSIAIFFCFKKQICFWVCWKGNGKLLNCALHLGLVFRTGKVGAITMGPLKKVKLCALLVGKGKIRVLPNG